MLLFTCCPFTTFCLKCSQQAADVLRVHCAPSSRALMEVLYGTGPSFDPGVQPGVSRLRIPGHCLLGLALWAVHSPPQSSGSSLSTCGCIPSETVLFPGHTSTKSSFSCSRLSHWCPWPGIAEGQSC